MAITAAERNWILQRLPSGVDTQDAFTKNGVTQTVSEAVDAAYSDNDGETNAKMLALADVLDILASDIVWEDEKHGDSAFNKPLLQQRADHWRDRAASSATQAAGSFGFIEASFGNAAVRDEYSAD